MLRKSIKNMTMDDRELDSRFSNIESSLLDIMAVLEGEADKAKAVMAKGKKGKVSVKEKEDES